MLREWHVIEDIRRTSFDIKQRRGNIRLSNIFVFIRRHPFYARIRLAAPTTVNSTWRAASGDTRSSTAGSSREFTRWKFQRVHSAAPEIFVPRIYVGIIEGSIPKLSNGRNHISDWTSENINSLFHSVHDACLCLK